MSSPSPSSSPAPPAANVTSPPPSTPSPTSTPSAPPPSPSPPSPQTPAPTASPPPPAATPPTSAPPSGSALSPPPPPSTESPPSPPSTESPPSSSTPSPPPPTASSGGSSSNSPPPPPKTSSPPPPPSTTSSSSSSSGISTSAVVGIAIAGVVILLVLSLICIFCAKKKKRRRNEYGGEGYYVPPPPQQQHPGPKDGYYGAAPQQQWQQNNPPPPQQHMMQPKPTPPAPASAAAAWRPPSPQQPPTPPIAQSYMSSGGGSGSSYPGSEVPHPPPSPGMSLGFSKSTFTYEELAMATDGFSESNILGQGGFGYVHKGILPNGKEVAVKALKAGSGQGEREFRAEVEIISRVHHKHLVSLVGYCITGSQRMLVYEFVPNNNLEFHLHGKGRPTMEWSTRLRIALGAAKGLSYLHEDCHPKIIHRDIKASNILLDFKFEAKVADFGLAKIASDLNTHVSTRVMGTFGYLAPEYAASGKLTDKSDVFSFGVMLLELITGRRPVDTTNTFMDDSLVDWARPTLTRALEEDNFDSLVDPKLENNYNHNEMARMVACAAACVRHSARRRPRMGQIVRALEGDVSLSDLNEGIRPGHSSIYGSNGSSDYDNMQYKEDMKKFRQVALASQEYGSSEYGGTTSEYGLYQSGTSSGQTTREMELGKMKKDSRGGIPKDSRGFSGGSDI